MSYNNISNLELVIVDDNSSDGTHDIVSKLASKSKRIKIISRKRVE